MSTPPPPFVDAPPPPLQPPPGTHPTKADDSGVPTTTPPTPAAATAVPVAPGASAVVVGGRPVVSARNVPLHTNSDDAPMVRSMGPLGLLPPSSTPTSQSPVHQSAAASSLVPSQASPVHNSSCTVPFQCVTTPVQGHRSGRGSGLSVSRVSFDSLRGPAKADLASDGMEASLRSFDGSADNEAPTPASTAPAPPFPTTPTRVPVGSSAATVSSSSAALGAQAQPPSDAARPVTVTAGAAGVSAGAAIGAAPIASEALAGDQHQGCAGPQQAVRMLGNTKLFVGQIPQRQDAQQWLERLFGPYDVQEVQVRTVPSLDKRGDPWDKPVAAFVWVGTLESAETAVARLHNHEYKNGHMWFRLSVELSRSLVPPSFPFVQGA